MKKHLFSIILSIVFLIPLTIQADAIRAPSYQVDVTHSVIADVGSGGDAVAVSSTETMQRTQSVANIKLEPADLVNRVSQYNAHKSITATGIIGVSGGGFIGIRPIG